jgi:uncharacterized membrane protein YkvA (DUF1232 family)
MALNIIDKLKNVDLSKTTEKVSGVKTSLSNIFDKKSTSNLEEIPTENMHTELPNDNLIKEELLKATEKATVLIEKKNELQEKVIQYLAENSDKLKKWYSDSQINEKIDKVAKKAGGIVIYPVLLLFNLMKSPQTSVQDKMFIVAPLAYFVLPSDLIPDFIAGLGYVDDGLAIMKCIQSLSSSITPQIQEETKLQCESIFGELDEKIIAQISDTISKNKESITSTLTEANNKYKLADNNNVNSVEKRNKK